MGDACICCIEANFFFVHMSPAEEDSSVEESVFCSRKTSLRPGGVKCEEFVSGQAAADVRKLFPARLVFRPHDTATN